MKLIDADKLIEQFKNKNIQLTFELPVEKMLGQYIDIEDFSMLMQDAVQAYRKMVIDTIRNQNTAYDVEAVIEQLNSKAENHGGEDYYIEIGDAIGIVKGDFAEDNE